MPINPAEIQWDSIEESQVKWDVPEQPVIQQDQSAPGFFDILTGRFKETETIKALPEIGSAPELNALSVPAFKASLGLLSTGDTESLKGILQEQLGQDVFFSQDERGNIIVNLPSGQYALNMPGVSPQDIARTAMDVAAFTPAGRAASIPGAMGKAALTELGFESTEQALGGEEISPTEIALAGGLGGLGKGVEDALGLGYRAAKGSAADDIVTAGRESGIPVYTSDVLPPETFASRMAVETGEKIPVLGTGGMREAQQALREEAVQEIADKYSQFSYKAVVDSLKTQKNRVKRAAGNVLERVGTQLDEVGEIPLNNTTAAIADAATELNKPGVIKSAGALDDLARLMQSIDEAPQTFSSLKENRTAFREIIKGADKAERSQLTSRAKSILDNVEKAMKRDMNALAKENLSPENYSRWQKANSVYAEEATKLTKSRLKNVLDKGDITPESVETLLFSKKPSEVKSLYDSLTPTGRKNARAAVISKVVNSLSTRQSGMTPNSFATEMKKYGVQVDNLFNETEKKQINGLLRVLDATRRAQDAGVTTATGQQLLGGGAALSLFIDPGSTLGASGTAGGLARIYESQPVRNALLRLASVPKGSTRFEKALLEAQSALIAAAQTVRAETEEQR